MVPYRKLNLEGKDKVETSIFTGKDKRSIEFKPYTLKQYKSIQSLGYYELGGLGPSEVGSPDWNLKFSKSLKRKVYGGMAS